MRTPQTIKRIMPDSTRLKLKKKWKIMKKKRQAYMKKQAQKKLRTTFKYTNRINDYNYEPVQISGVVLKSHRDWQTRWDLIKQELESYKAESVLDIGCAEGWFLRRAAEDLGCFAIGVEMDSKRIVPAELARLHDDLDRFAIIKAKLDPETILKLPTCDVVLCLSVVHHVIRRGGVGAAKAFVKALSTRANKALIFEMGTAEEKEMKWAQNLPEMPEGQDLYLRRFLESCDLVNIRNLGKSLSYSKETERSLYLAETPGK